MEPLWKKRIREAVDEKFQGNMTAASMRAGLGKTFVRDMFERERMPGVDKLEKLASAVGVPMPALFSDDYQARQVPVVGHVQAGAETHLYGTGQGPFGWEPMPPDASARTVAVIVRGDSMAGTADNGAVLYYDDRRDPPTDDLIGKLCIVGLTDGRVLAKKLYRGTKKDRWNLLSTNLAPLLDQKVDWAARVIWIKP